MTAAGWKVLAPEKVMKVPVTGRRSAIECAPGDGRVP